MKDRENRGDAQPHIFETDFREIVVFLGIWGNGGVLVAERKENGISWEFHPCGTLVWDRYHQSVYRNAKAVRLTHGDLEKRGIPAPPVDQYQDRPSIAWKDNFLSEVPFEEVPRELLAELREKADQWRALYLVLEEDQYETYFGDGKFLQVGAAFWDEDSARRFLDRVRSEQALLGKELKEEGTDYVRYAYYLKEIKIKVDETEKKVVADLDINNYEHCSLDFVLMHLAMPPSP